MLSTKHFVVVGLLVCGLLGSCTPASTKTAAPLLTATVTTPATEALPTRSPAELIRVVGQGAPYTSTPWHVAKATTLRAHWDQSSTGEFDFVVANNNTQATETANEDVTFELTVGPSSGSGNSAFSPGDYVIKVVSADGPWQIWIELVPTE